MAAREGSHCNDGKKIVKRVRAIKYYSHCGEKGHNSRTYIIKIEDADDSDTFKE